MVENWEIEWNSSMLKHGTDLGTANFIIEKGGNLSDINYVFFNVRDDSWEPIIKAVADRDNSHIDIIRKEVAQFDDPRSAKQYNRAQQAMTAGQSVREAEGQGMRATPQQYRRAGLYGSAMKEGLSNFFGQGSVDKEPGMGARMGRFMSDLRHAPRAMGQGVKQFFRDREDTGRQSRLQGGKRRFNQERNQAINTNVPGSRGFNRNMDQAMAGINQRLADDYRLEINTDKDGKPKETAQQAMDRELEGINQRLTSARPTLGERVRALGDARRAKKRGDAYAPSNVPSSEAEEQEEEEIPTMPSPPSPEAAQAANADAPAPKREMQPLDVGDVTGPVKDAPPATQAGPPTPAEPAVATATEAPTSKDPTRGQTFATEGGMKLGKPAGDRVASGLDKILEQHKNTPFTDRDAAFQAMLQGGVGTEGMTAAGKTKIVVEAVLTDMFGPAQAKQITQAAQQGNPDAKQIVEEAIQNLDVGDVTAQPEKLDVGDIDPFKINASEDKHEVSWDSLLKGLNIR